ncbi:geranylgeranyl pyrophosphate synthase [Haloferula luteola]|uniref:Geranylgeranyl pyrophosphate synthase n=1 Tax=Haloferula luteola TaxID=595692 RepID=A0A840V693_9BACT|nr:polyprenyl synthetase family protein [Haloferula luteola]MBB5352546.1 geranylgeranyl pyrophosphate synthase [Haloferula luteola]
MNPDFWWAKRASCAKALMAESFRQGMGRPEGVERRLAAALGDLLARPGSLTRAVAAYLVGIEMGVPEAQARAMACGIEYLHTASLVFDDLPAMDDAVTRRSMPALHVLHGEGTAMLAALAMINRGYLLLWQGMNGASLARRERAGEWVDRCLGTVGMIGGQSHDLGDWQGGQSAADVSEVAARKTGDLLRLTLVLPAMIGRASERELQLLDRLALLRGLAYQAADDVKDVVGGAGKTAGRDEALGRPNLVMAEGFAAAVVRLERLVVVGDRVQAALPGPAERWGMLVPLRIEIPEGVAALLSEGDTAAG